MPASADRPALRLSIVGHGPVGLALALFAIRAGVATSAIRFDPPLGEHEALPDSFALRTLALSLGSWQLLKRIITVPPAGVIEQVDVSLRGRAGRTVIRASDLSAAALGYVTDYRSLLQALRLAISSRWTLASRAESDHGLAEQGALKQAQLDRGANTCIVVHAEGNPGDQVNSREFDQHAILTSLVCPSLDSRIAIERFTADGPVALLPLAAPHQFGLVWCCRAEQARRRSALADSEFLSELQSLIAPSLRGASVAGPRIAAPLQRRQRTHTLIGNQVWIGNAAQAMHPVAGQGLNLGLRDAFELAQALGQLFRSADPRAAMLDSLQAFDRARLTDRRRTIRITDTLALMFTRPWAAPAQSLALSILDLTPIARRGFAQRMMFGHG